MKGLIKELLYSVTSSRSLKKYQLHLGYIFHTERIMDDKLFAAFTNFCRDYHSITDAHPICTCIPPTSIHIRHWIQKSGLSDEKFRDRLAELSEISTIGYHGHFYQTENFAYENAIHTFSFNKEVLRSQFYRDLEWFDKNKINHHGIYAGGWWFTNRFLIELLTENNFKTDFSSSQAKYFYNGFANNIMSENKIRPGEPFSFHYRNKERSLLCIQNFIGAHTTPYPLDFDRNMKKLNFSEGNSNVGVINSHDYDLNAAYTLKCIEHLLINADARFYSYKELRGLAESKVSKKIEMDE